MKKNVIRRKSARIRSTTVTPVRRRIPRPVNGDIISVDDLTNRMRQGIHEHLALGTFTLEHLMLWYTTDFRRRS